MSHEWNNEKSVNYFQSNVDNGASAKLASIALSKDAIGWQDEFVLMKPLIPFDYLVNEEGRWVNDGGKTVEELNDPNDVGGDRIGRTLHAESSMMNDSSVQMAATISPDLGYGRSFIYLYSRGENNSIRALAVEFKGTDAQLQRFFIGLGLKGNADISDSSNHDKALLFKKAINPLQILEEATNSLSGDNSQQEYLDRLSRTVSTFPLLLEERNRQIEQFANRAMELMMTEKDTQQGLAMAVYGVMELARQMTDTTIQHVYSDSVETISGIFDYISRERDTKEYQNISLEYRQEDWEIAPSVKELLSDDKSPAFTTLSSEPISSTDTDEYSTDMVSVWKLVAQETLHISTEQSETLYEEVVHTYEIIETANAIITISAANEYMPVSSAIFALGIISSTMEDFTTTSESTVSEFVQQTDGEITELSKSDSRTNDVIDILIGKNISKELIELTSDFLEQLEPQQRADIYIDYETIIRTVDFLQILQHIPESQMEALLENEKINTVLRVDQLMEVFQQLLSHDSGVYSLTPDISAESPFNPISSELISQEQNLQQFSIAVTLLVLYKHMNYFSSMEKIQSVIHKNIVDDLNHKEKFASIIQSLKESSKEMIEKEPAPWLLFAIIWHLSMIREQGFAQSSSTATPAPKTQTSIKKKSNLQQRLICNPSFFDIPTGVIYAFNHVMIEV